MPKITEMLKIRENAKNHRKYQKSPIKPKIPRMPKITNNAENFIYVPPTYTYDDILISLMHLFLKHF